jgi:hypothetical protein
VLLVDETAPGHRDRFVKAPVPGSKLELSRVGRILRSCQSGDKLDRYWTVKLASRDVCPYEERPRFQDLSSIAGAGFEPATFGL